MGVLRSLIIVDLLSHVKLLPKSCAVRYYLAGMSFEVKHSKRETVISRSAQEAKIKKTKVETPGPQELDNNC